MRGAAFRHALVATSLLACEGGKGPPDARHGYDDDGPWCVSESITQQVSEPPPAHLLHLVRACEANPSKCEELCWSVLYGSQPGGGISLDKCTVDHTNGHTVTVVYCRIGAEGRRPAGLARSRGRCRDVVGARLARAAYHEAASIHAFVRLTGELRRLRAPRRLVAASRRATVDEIRHARAMAALAHVRGATPPPVVVAPARRRSLEAIAIENVREGVVGEAWSAVIALWQARHAPTAELRATYARIADDEVRHAELAAELAAWAQRQLRPAARARVQRARARAIATLASSLRRGPSAELVRELGMPDGAALRAMFEHARTTLWI